MNAEAKDWYQLSLEDFNANSYREAQQKAKKCISLLTCRLKKEEFNWLYRIYQYSLYYLLANKLYTLGHYEDAMAYFASLDFSTAPEEILERLKISRFKSIHPKQEKSKWGYADNFGEFIIQPRYDSAKKFYDGFAYVMKNNKVGLLNRKGDLLIPTEYDRILYDETLQFKEQPIPVVKNGKFGFINKRNKVIIPFQYSDAFLFKNGLAAAKKGKYGFINEQGETVIPFIYDYPHYSESPFIVVKKNNLYGYLDFLGNERIPIQFEGASLFSDGLASVRKNGEYGIIDEEGHQIIPFEYDFINGIYSGIIWVKKNNKEYFINEKNTIIYSTNN